MGFILFARNIAEPDQIRFLTSSLRELSGRSDVPILIDQEGGRVARLRPPYWRETLPAEIYAKIAKRNLNDGTRAVFINHCLIAHELADLGININCAPVADLRLPGASDIIGDRAFGQNPEEIVPLAIAAAKGLRQAGVLPIMKHIPGHGRALVDSHLKLPVVDTMLEELDRTDFQVFRSLAKEISWAMTAHIVYQAIDPDQAATLSPKLIAEIIRGSIGFDGFLISDDLGMKALSGEFSFLTKKTLEAGCDAVLHCSGDFREMKEVAKGLRPLAGKPALRFEQSWQGVTKDAYIDVPELRHELSKLLESDLHAS